MKKRKQHYVWEHYLRAWATNGQVWCSTRGRRFLSSTENIAQERDFYRLKEMSERDLQWVEKLVIEQATGPLSDLARGWVPHFNLFHRLKREYEAGGKSNPELEAVLDESINNMEEDLHGSIERKAVPLLARLRDADATVLDDDQDCIHLFWFIGMQYMRTPRMAQDVVEAAREIPGFNAEAAWGLMRTIFANNLGYSFYARRRNLHLTFLDAPADADFMTGDQPIINVRAGGLPEGQPPAEGELALYYPLTPMRAMLLAFDAAEATTERRSLTKEEVATYNRMIMDASHEQVYARTEVALVASLEPQWPHP